MIAALGAEFEGADGAEGSRDVNVDDLVVVAECGFVSAVAGFCVSGWRYCGR